MRSTDHELASRIDMIDDMVVEKGFLHVAESCQQTWHEDIDHILANLGLHSLVGIELIVLSRNDYGIDTHWTVLLIIFDSHLTLGIRTKIRHKVGLLTNLGKFDKEELAQFEGQRHIVVALVGRITEHHSLVACALKGFLMANDSTVDVIALLVDGTENTTAVAIEFILSLGIADAVDDSTRCVEKIDISIALDLAGKNDLSCSDKCLTSHLAVRILCKKLVENSIADLVSHFVWVSFRHRFRSKQIIHKKNFLNGSQSLATFGMVANH